MVTEKETQSTTARNRSIGKEEKKRKEGEIMIEGKKEKKDVQSLNGKSGKQCQCTAARKRSI